MFCAWCFTCTTCAGRPGCGRNTRSGEMTLLMLAPEVGLATPTAVVLQNCLAGSGRSIPICAQLRNEAPTGTELRTFTE